MYFHYHISFLTILYIILLFERAPMARTGGNVHIIFRRLHELPKLREKGELHIMTEVQILYGIERYLQNKPFPVHFLSLHKSIKTVQIIHGQYPALADVHLIRSS